MWTWESLERQESGAWRADNNWSNTEQWGTNILGNWTEEEGEETERESSESGRWETESGAIEVRGILH